MQRSSCLVVGGAGNLGGHIVRLLRERGAKRVACFDLVAYPDPAVESITGNVTDEAALTAAMAGIDIVYHVASIIDITPVPSLMMNHVNVTGTVCVINACKAARVKSLVYTASLEVVSGADENGVSRELDGVDETAPIPAQHHLPYAATKAAAEQLVLAADSAELRTCSIRPGYIMGRGCIGLKVEMLTSAERAGYYVTAKVPATISTVHPRNAALLHVRAAEQLARPEVHGHAFFCRDFEDNVIGMALRAFEGTGIKPLLLPLWLAYAMAWLLDLVERVLIWCYAVCGAKRVTPSHVVGIRAVGMAWIDVVVSDRKAREVLGHQPEVTREECLREANEWCKECCAKLLAQK